MITKNKFVQYLSTVEDYIHNPLTQGDQLCDDYVKMLETLAHDRWGVTGWFVFEADFGRVETKWVFDNVTWTVDSKERLYDLLTALFCLTQPSRQSSTGPH